MASKAAALFGVFSESAMLLLLLFATSLSVLVTAGFGTGRPRGANNWFGRRRLKRDNGFCDWSADADADADDDFSSLSALGSLAFKLSDDGSSLRGNEVLVLGTVERDRPRKFTVGRARIVRCVVEDTWADVSIEFSSNVFSSNDAEIDVGVVFKFKRPRAKISEKPDWIPEANKKQKTKTKIFW